MIKVAGSNVSPAEVEGVLAELAGVLHAFVIGLPHSVRGQAVGSVIVPRHGARLAAQEVTAFARARLSAFKVPTVVRFVAEQELPMLPTGKADRQALARLLNSSSGTG
jgi:acyl-CoA synthetase (AMP-forming)/AMP-acid ligase II